MIDRHRGCGMKRGSPIGVGLYTVATSTVTVTFVVHHRRLRMGEISVLDCKRGLERVLGPVVNPVPVASCRPAVRYDSARQPLRIET